MLVFATLLACEDQRFVRCANASKAKSESLLTLSFQIEANGRTADISVDVPDENQNRCVAKIIAGMRFRGAKKPAKALVKATMVVPYHL